MATSGRRGTEMTATQLHFDSTARRTTVRDDRFGHVVRALVGGLGQVLGRTRALFDGSRWEPGRDWMARVEDWDHPQASR
jgi:hypothetical protein